MMFIQRRVARITNSIYHRIYLSGWGGWVMPRTIRKLIAGSEIHRAWFFGYNGYFEEDGVAYGLARPYTEILDHFSIEDLKKLRSIPEHERTHVQQLYIDQQDHWYEYYGDDSSQEELSSQEEARNIHEDWPDLWYEYND